MTQRKFDHLYIKNLKPKEIEYQKREAADRREESGFGIRVFPSGSKHWIYVYRINGKRRIMTLGHFPDMSLADARTEFHKERGLVRKEAQDPIALRQSKDQADKNQLEEELNAPTLKTLANDYLKLHAKAKKRSWKEDERILNRDVIPIWGDRKAADIKKRDVNIMLQSIVNRGAPVMANNTFKIVRKMFNWAVKNDYIEVSPTLNIELPTPKKDRNRTLTKSEIQVVWNSLNDATMSDGVRRAIMLILVTAQRPNEVVGMRTDEIDGHWWTIPVSRQKVPKMKETERHPHRVYLTDLALGLIGELDSVDAATGKKIRKEYVFPCPHKDKNKAINRHALSRAILNNCPLNCVNDCDKCTITECKSDTSSSLKEKNKLNIVYFTPHDLRRTASTMMAQLNISDEVNDAILNHVKYGTIKIYNQYKYDSQKITTMKKLTKLLILETSK